MEGAICLACRERTREGTRGQLLTHPPDGELRTGLSSSRSVPQVPSFISSSTDLRRQTLGMEAPQTGTLEPTGVSAVITQHVAPRISSLLFSSSLSETFDFPSTQERTGALLLRPEARFWERTQPHACLLPAARRLQLGEDLLPGAELRVAGLRLVLKFQNVVLMEKNVRNNKMQSAMPHHRCPAYFIRMREHLWSGVSHTRGGAQGGKRKTGGALE